MISIYDVGNTTYTKNGDAVLIPTECKLSMTINGAWTLTMTHPYDDEERYKHIVDDAVIRVTDVNCFYQYTSEAQKTHLFRIYNHKRTNSGVVATAFPIALEANYDFPIVNLNATDKTGTEAMAMFQALTNKYTLSCDIADVTKTGQWANTNFISALSGGNDDSFAKLWGGEVMYHNYNISVKKRLGDNTSETVEPVMYGRNTNLIDYTKDESGVVTRLYPISADGIRLNGTGYVDSDHIGDYPFIRILFAQAPYNLVDTDETHNNNTALMTRRQYDLLVARARLDSMATYNTALTNGWEREYFKNNRNEIIAAIQTECIANITHEKLAKLIIDAIKEGMSWMDDITRPEWTWHQNETGWWYGSSSTDYAKNQWCYINRTWCWFNAEGYWVEKWDDKGAWDWIQTKDSQHYWFGNNQKYYAHDEWIYETVSGELKYYWLNDEGWYESDYTGVSGWTWHAWGDGWWFGEEGASLDDTSKFAHDQWIWIDGTYYFFDSTGYNAPDAKIENYAWSWQEDNQKYWFGNTDKAYGANYLKSQWQKISNEWYKFDSNGYMISPSTLLTDAINLFKTGMATTKTACGNAKTTLYNLLYDNMEGWCDDRFDDGLDMPAVTINVNLIDLSKTSDYKDYEYLETLHLGDRVKILDYDHDISAVERIVGLTYDCIEKYNTAVVVGVAQGSIASLLGVGNGEAQAQGGYDMSLIESKLQTDAENIAALQSGKQDKLTAGQNITINGNVISATGGSEYRELTQDEYDALPSSKNSDGIIYFIKDCKIIKDDSGIVVTIDSNNKITWYFNNYSYTNQQDLPVPNALRQYLPTPVTSEACSSRTSAYNHENDGERDGWIGFVFNLYEYPCIRAWTDEGYFNAGRFDGQYVVGDGDGGNPENQVHEYHYTEGEDVPSEAKYGKIMLNGFTYTKDGGKDEIKALTQTEYDDLPASKLTDGIAYFIEDVEEYDSSYEFHEYEDGQGGKIVVRIHGNETKWFFMGWHQTSGEMAIPSELFTYRPADPYSAIYSANYPNGGTVQDGWIGFYNDNIRAWSQNLGVLVTGVMYGVVDIDGGADQTNPYENPYGTSEYKIVMNGHNYSGG